MLDLQLRNRKKEKNLGPKISQADRLKNELKEDLFFKCPGCNNTFKKKTFEKNLYVCAACGYHLKMPVKNRIEETFSRWTPLFENLASVNPLNFEGYEQKVKDYKKSSGNSEAVSVGTVKIGRVMAVAAIMDPFFMMGSMGSVVGERITMAFEYATKNKMSIIIFTASGGARMQEGLFSLMQMAKTAAAVKKHANEGLFYLTVLTNPTTGGVTASFAMLGDIHIAEPGALVGFAGPRVIAQTTRQTLPEGFQTAEFVKEHGFIDMIVKRGNLRKIIERLVTIHNKGA